MILTLPWPPTANTYYRHVSKGPLAGRTLISERGRSYRTAVGRIVSRALSCAALSGPVAVDIECRPPDRRKRDLDNLTKSLLDALTHAGVWCDDSLIDDLRIWRSPQLEGLVLVRICPVLAGGGA